MIIFGSFPPSQWSSTNHSLLGSKEPTLLCNHLSTGAHFTIYQACGSIPSVTLFKHDGQAWLHVTLNTKLGYVRTITGETLCRSSRPSSAACHLRSAHDGETVGCTFLTFIRTASSPWPSTARWRHWHTYPNNLRGLGFSPTAGC